MACHRIRFGKDADRLRQVTGGIVGKRLTYKKMTGEDIDQQTDRK
jgi:hypothetical protein